MLEDDLVRMRRLAEASGITVLDDQEEETLVEKAENMDQERVFESAARDSTKESGGLFTF